MKQKEEVAFFILSNGNWLVKIVLGDSIKSSWEKRNPVRAGNKAAFFNTGLVHQ